MTELPQRDLPITFLPLVYQGTYEEFEAFKRGHELGQAKQKLADQIPFTELYKAYDELKEELADATRKGEELCCAYGNALIEITELKAHDERRHIPEGKYCGLCDQPLSERCLFLMDCECPFIADRRNQMIGWDDEGYLKHPDCPVPLKENTE